MSYRTYLFDLDGVLTDTDYIQYQTICEAIKEILNYDILEVPILVSVFKTTITTLEKLQFLKKHLFIDNKIIDIIYKRKKELADVYFSKLEKDLEKINLMKYLKNKNYKIAVVTNANKCSTTIILKNIGIYQYIDVIITNEDVINKKPSPEPYLKAINLLKSDINDCIIFEDSEVGLISAKNTGCKYYHIKSYLNVNIDFIKKIESLNY